MVVDSYISKSANATTRQSLPEVLRGCGSVNLKKAKIYSIVEREIVQYLYCFAENDTGMYCIYIERKYQETEETSLQRVKSGWHKSKIDVTFGDTIVHNVLKAPVPPIHGEYSGSLRHFQSQKRLAAGRQYAAGLLKKVSGMDGQEIYENLNLVSALAYESQENKGNMAIIPSNVLYGLKDKLEIMFALPVQMTSHKGVRKLFEIVSGDGVCLACDGTKIYGLISQNSLNTECKGKFLLIKMRGYLNWEILEPEKDGGNRLPRIDFNGTNFILNETNKNQKRREDIERKLFEILSNDGKGNSACERCGYNRKCNSFETVEDGKETVKHWSKIINKVLNAAAEQTHGTTIVFSRYAEEEADRLQKTSFQIKMKLLEDAALIKQITAIDGAVLCDFNGNCYTIGVILDGKTIEGDSDETIDRGARFNSAIRYKNAFPCSVICIVSEDGDVNVV